MESNGRILTNFKVVFKILMVRCAPQDQMLRYSVSRILRISQESPSPRFAIMYICTMYVPSMYLVELYDGGRVQKLNEGTGEDAVARIVLLFIHLFQNRRDDKHIASLFFTSIISIF